VYSLLCFTEVGVLQCTPTVDAHVSVCHQDRHVTTTHTHSAATFLMPTPSVSPPNDYRTPISLTRQWWWVHHTTPHSLTSLAHLQWWPHNTTTMTMMPVMLSLTVPDDHDHPPSFSFTSDNRHHPTPQLSLSPLMTMTTHSFICRNDWHHTCQQEIYLCRYTLCQ
jgi:hypothetical protein